MNEFSKVLVTGGAGFIGSRLVGRLISDGYSVVVLDNFYSGRLGNLKRHLSCDGFRLVEGDVRDGKAVRDAIRGVDAVVHLAALIDVEGSVADPLGTHDVNVNGALNLLYESVKHGVKRFLFASSAAVYGDGDSLPLTEDSPLRPVSPYAASKVAAEHYCSAFFRSYGLGTVILRYFNVYGPGQGHNPYVGVISRFLSNALNGEPMVVFGDGEQSRDFIYLDDVVEASMLALENGNSVGEVLNVCTGRCSTINELVEVVKDVTGRNFKTKYGEERKGDIRMSHGDSTKAEEVLRFKAKIDLRRGLELTKEGLTF